MPSVDELASELGLDYKGDGEGAINSVATLSNAVAGQLSFLSNSKFKKHLESTKASAVILSIKDVNDCPVTAIIADDPYLAYARAANLLYPQTNIFPAQQIHESVVTGKDCSFGDNVVLAANSVIGDRVKLGANTYIGPGCVVSDGCQIGHSTILKANVTLMDEAIIGDRCIIHPGVVIGADGFGFANDHGAWVKIPQVGTVLIGDDVEIGANTTIDRGAIDNTVINNGVKLDNLIQLGHNVHIGQHTAIASSTAIAGSTSIGEYCMIAGAVAIAGHLTIADHVTINGMSMVSHTIEKKGVYSGIPVQEARAWRRSTARMKQLDELFKRVLKLEK